MRDRETELHYYPKDRLSLDGVASVLCIAPHPDDEVLGCGGALAMLVKQGATVKSLIVTQGDKALGVSNSGHANLRKQESLFAAQILGCAPPQFLDFEDRNLSYSASLVSALSSAMQSHLSATSLGLLFLPSLSEPHPDHQVVALAGLQAALQWQGPLRVLFYEVGAPLHPNTYIDITEVLQTKWQALAQFESQLGLQNYEGHSRAFASLRSFGLGPDCKAAEAYFEVDLANVKRVGPLAALPQWPWVRSRLQLANGPQDLPLVSVLIRSMDRQTLAETLASVVQQSYPNIEVVVVNAKGSLHSPLNYVPEQMQLRLIEPADQAGLGRSAAANLAMDHAQGSLALFLDDDDLIAPEHLQRLVQTLHDQPGMVGAYSGVQVVGADGQVIREYDTPWSPHRMSGINFLPIHAVLFRMDSVRERHIRFNTTLPVLEDWDFWHQLTQDHDLLHCPGVSAVYRQGLGQSNLSDPAHANYWKNWHRQLLERYLSSATLHQTAEALAWHAIELDQLTARLDQLILQERALQQRFAQSQTDLRLLDQQTRQHVQARDQLQQELERYSLQMQAELSAQEVKLHSYAAQSMAALSAKASQLQAFSETSQQALSEKEAQLQAFSETSQQALSEKEAQLQEFSEKSQQALSEKEAQLQEFSEKSQQALSEKEAQLQEFSEKSQQALSEKEAQLQEFSEKSQQALSEKEAQLQEFSEKSQQALAEKEAQLQEFSEKSQQALAEKEAQLQNEILQKLELQQTLDNLLGSRWWRWGQSIRHIMGRRTT
jgi:LmbE family N-acetylglucosaminyl deacetylase